MSSALFALPALLSHGKPVLCAWCTLPDPAIAGVLAREPGFGAVSVDLQHGAIDYAAAAKAFPLINAAGKSAVARIPVGEYALASRLLDAGASAIVAPMIQGVDDAREFAHFMKYAPIGSRSWGPTTAVALSGLDPVGYLGAANKGILAFAMIETREAFGQIDEILGVDGIDGIFIGPSDLSIAFSNGKLDPMSTEVEAAVDHAVARTRRAGKVPAIFAPSGERAGNFARRGYSFISVGSDNLMLKAGAAAMINAANG
jgi:4-hydroxy-2-oxoheptanedioate aldolase